MHCPLHSPGGLLLSILVPGFHNTSECFHDSQPVMTDVSLCVPTRRRMLVRTQHAHVLPQEVGSFEFVLLCVIPCLSYF